MQGKALAHGELVQWPAGGLVVSRLLFRFSDGSLYDEVVRFSQRPVFRVRSYHLVQRGPAFGETLEVSFDRDGSYRVRRREKPGAKEEQVSGRTEVPDDVSNGMTSILLKNLPPGSSTTTHLLTFTPRPRVLAVLLRPEGSDRFWVGSATNGATRFLVQPEVEGVLGAVASIVGKQPSPVRMWIAEGPAPTLVKFEGALYADGPTWRVVPTGPHWSR